MCCNFFVVIRKEVKEEGSGTTFGLQSTLLIDYEEASGSGLMNTKDSIIQRPSAAAVEDIAEYSPISSGTFEASAYLSSNGEHDQEQNVSKAGHNEGFVITECMEEPMSIGRNIPVSGHLVGEANDQAVNTRAHHEVSTASSEPISLSNSVLEALDNLLNEI